MFAGRVFDDEDCSGMGEGEKIGVAQGTRDQAFVVGGIAEDPVKLSLFLVQKAAGGLEGFCNHMGPLV